MKGLAELEEKRALCLEAAARIAELEAVVEAIAANRNCNRDRDDTMWRTWAVNFAREALAKGK